MKAPCDTRGDPECTDSCPPPLRGAALGVLLVSVACSGPDAGKPVAIPSFEVHPTEVPLGSPIEATLSFSVLPDAAFDEDYVVFLHFLNDDGELIWVADHYPPRPTTEWQPGDTIEYTRTILVPRCPYLGDTDVSIGLYSLQDGTRLPLEGDHDGRLAYTVGRLSLLPPTGSVRFSYRSGWHALEGDSTCVQWRWSEKVGVIVFDNPRRDSLLYLHLDEVEATDDEPRTLTVSVGDRLADRFEIVPGNVVHEIPLTTSLLGDTNEIELRLEVDRIFVPAELPDSDNLDPRALGVRVLGAYLTGATREPHGQL